MKLFKNPVFAVVLCLLMIVSSFFLTGLKMEKKYDRLCGELYEEIIDFSSENGLGSLKNDAHAAAASGDYRSLISTYNEYAMGNYRDSDDVEDAIRSITRFLRNSQRFPASLYVNLFDLTF